MLIDYKIFWARLGYMTLKKNCPESDRMRDPSTLIGDVSQNQIVLSRFNMFIHVVLRDTRGGVSISMHACEHFVYMQKTAPCTLPLWFKLDLSPWIHHQEDG